MKIKILILEDEMSLARFLKDNLCAAGFEVLHYASLSACGNQTHSAQIAIVDLMLGFESGDQWVRAIREAGDQTPILILSAFGQTSKKIELIEAGADDYLTKPFDVGELLARVNALLRRGKVGKDASIGRFDKIREDYGAFKFLHEQSAVLINGELIALTKKEFLLMEYFLQREGQVIPNEDILRDIWHAHVGYHSNILQATLKRLRKKLQKDHDKEEHFWIQNHRGVGYCFTPPIAMDKPKQAE